MKVRLQLQQRGEHARVWLDDVEVTRTVRAVRIDAACGQLTNVVLDLVPTEVEIEGEPAAVYTRRFSCLKPDQEPVIAIANDVEARGEGQDAAGDASQTPMAPNA